MATGDATDDALVAAVFRAALSLGIATPADLVPRADAQIVARDRPEEWIIDLSLGAEVPADQVCAALRDTRMSADPNATFRLMAGLIDEPDHWALDRARLTVRFLYNAAGVCHLSDEASAELDRLDTYLNLADELRYPDSVVVDAVRFLRKYANPAARAWLPGVRVTFADG